MRARSCVRVLSVLLLLTLPLLAPYASAAADATLTDLVGTSLSGPSEPIAVSSGGIVAGIYQDQTYPYDQRGFFVDLHDPGLPVVELDSLKAGLLPVDVDERLVVGNVQRTSYPYTHEIYVYDPDHSSLVGPLPTGHTDSEAAAMHDGVIVGEVDCNVCGGYVSPRAFAYDLATSTMRLLDTSTYDGGWSRAVAVHDGLVVGTAHSSIPSRTFYYDLTASDPEMVLLAPLDPADNYNAIGVGGGVIGGNQHRGEDFRGFAYDLNAATPQIVPLSSTGTYSEVSAVNAAGVVVGGRRTASGLRAFSYDARASSPQVVELPLPEGGTESFAMAVSDDGVIVGHASGSTDGNYWRRAFAYDLATREMVFLPSLRAAGENDAATSVATVGDETVAVGTSYPSAAPEWWRAVAWRMEGATSPVVEIGSISVDGATVTVPFAVTGTSDHPTCKLDDGAEIACDSTTQHIFTGVATGGHTVIVAAGGANDSETFTVGCSGGLMLANDAGTQTGSPGRPGSWTFTVTAQNCTGAGLSGLKMQGGTGGWLSTDGWRTDPTTLTVTSSAKGKKNTVLTGTLAELADQETARITVDVSGTVGKKAVCGSQLEISGSWSASALAVDGSTVRSPAAPPATIYIDCDTG
jgi:hypothetical protein